VNKEEILSIIDNNIPARDNLKIARNIYNALSKAGVLSPSCEAKRREFEICPDCVERFGGCDCIKGPSLKVREVEPKESEPTGSKNSLTINDQRYEIQPDGTLQPWPQVHIKAPKMEELRKFLKNQIEKDKLTPSCYSRNAGILAYEIVLSKLDEINKE